MAVDRPTYDFDLQRPKMSHSRMLSFRDPLEDGSLLPVTLSQTVMKVAVHEANAPSEVMASAVGAQLRRVACHSGAVAAAAAAGGLPTGTHGSSPTAKGAGELPMAQADEPRSLGQEIWAFHIDPQRRLLVEAEGAEEAVELEADEHRRHDRRDRHCTRRCSARPWALLHWCTVRHHLHHHRR